MSNKETLGPGGHIHCSGPQLNGWEKSDVTALTAGAAGRCHG
jgi:hypothetical protein